LAERELGVGPAAQRRLVVRRPLQGAVEGGQRLSRLARPRQRRADPHERQRSIRGESRGLTVGGQRRIGAATQRGHVPASQCVLVALVERFGHVIP
jgi:hypothetical protein